MVRYPLTGAVEMVSREFAGDAVVAAVVAEEEILIASLRISQAMLHSKRVMGF